MMKRHIYWKTMKHVLETPRLILREMSLADLDFIAEMLAHPEVMRYYPKCYTREEAAAWIRKQQDRYSKHGRAFWLALDKASGRPVGQAGVVTQKLDGVVEDELAYMMHHPFWRKGYATEAAMASRDYVFNTLGKSRVISLIRPENLPSQGVATKVGLKPERYTVFAGFDHIVYSLSRPGPQQISSTERS